MLLYGIPYNDWGIRSQCLNSVNRHSHTCYRIQVIPQTLYSKFSLYFSQFSVHFSFQFSTFLTNFLSSLSFNVLSISSISSNCTTHYSPTHSTSSHLHTVKYHHHVKKTPNTRQRVIQHQSWLCAAERPSCGAKLPSKSQGWRHLHWQ